ncbi:MAG: glycoside hydrolase family 5 protein [Calditrichaeota bacterium]|nr:glycoside hydrolase family 5 protein [Calditrichota bacterium]
MLFSGCTRHVSPISSQEEKTAPPDPFLQNDRLGRGINLGNALDAPYEGAWGVVLKESYFQKIAKAGFNSVRIPIRWSAHADTAKPYTIDPAFMARVDWAVRQALRYKLAVVINIHHYDALMQNPSGQEERFLALWNQISLHFRNFSDAVLFEILNEPHANLTPQLWNALLPKALAVIRASNPLRTVVVGTANWGGIASLSDLKIPEEEQNAIVTVHYYNPFHFTHQGAEWVSGSQAWLGTQWNATAAEVAAINQDFDRVADWARQHNRPIYVGEFGAYSKADLVSRALWTNAVARAAEARHFSWAYWEFCSGFGAYDPVKEQWIPQLLKALIP